jgi:hypothetical protein
MFRPFRLLVLGALALAIYAVFFKVPGEAGATAFDADKVAAYEVESWKAAKVHSHWSMFVNSTHMLRELHHNTWYRAAEQGYPLGQAMSAFADMTDRFQRAFPDLEDAATVEKAARKAAFDPAAVARAQINWMTTARMPNISDNDQTAELLAEEYGLRYGVRPDQVYAAALPRVQALKLWLAPGIEPDYVSITRLLTDSYRALNLGLEQARSGRVPAL